MKIAHFVNLSNLECLRESPAYVRIGGFVHSSPDARIDIAGTVDDVGEGVTQYRRGDEV